MSVPSKERPLSDVSTRTALHRVALRGVCNEFGGDLTLYETAIVDTLRVLSQAQTDFSQNDIRYFAWFYYGPPSGIEFLLLQHANLTSTEGEEDEVVSAYAFAKAVTLFGEGYSQWESVIRQLIRGGVYIHGRVHKRQIEPWYYETLQATKVLGTPLDELFEGTNTPLEARTISKSWIRILVSEGFDILAYLQEEITIHTAQHLLTWSNDLDYRKLIFQLGENPGVWWDWQLHPESGALLVRDPFKSLNSMNDFGYVGVWRPDSPQRDPWPWRYQKWLWLAWNLEYNMVEVSRRRDLAHARATRRVAKRASKMRRALGMKTASQMPGAWPL